MAVWEKSGAKQKAGAAKCVRYTLPLSDRILYMNN